MLGLDRVLIRGQPDTPIGPVSARRLRWCFPADQHPVVLQLRCQRATFDRGFAFLEAPCLVFRTEPLHRGLVVAVSWVEHAPLLQEPRDRVLRFPVVLCRTPDGLWFHQPVQGVPGGTFDDPGEDGGGVVSDEDLLEVADFFVFGDFVEEGDFS